MFENFNFGKTGFKTSVFEKHFISFSCILFIKYYALRSFCIKLIFFSFKKLVFPEFRSFEPVSQPIEIAIKILVWLYVFRSMLDWFWINRRHFWLIKYIFRSIEIRIESFLKPFFLTCFVTFKLFQKLFSLYSIGPRLLARFLSFSLKFLQVFLSSYTGKTLLPFLFHLFSFFLH